MPPGGRHPTCRTCARVSELLYEELSIPGGDLDLLSTAEDYLGWHGLGLLQGTRRLPNSSAAGGEVGVHARTRLVAAVGHQVVEFLCETDQVAPGKIYRPKGEHTGSKLGAFNVRGAHLVRDDYIERELEGERLDAAAGRR